MCESGSGNAIGGGDEDPHTVAIEGENRHEEIEEVGRLESGAGRARAARGAQTTCMQVARR
jgi:hypothetical protein